MLSVVARWRNLYWFVMAISIVGCRRAKEVVLKPPAPPMQQAADTVAFHFTMENRGRQAESISVVIDGVATAQHLLKPRESKSFSVPVRKGWHMIQTRSTSGVAHQAMVQGDKEKWILVRRDPSKPEGFGVHVTEYRRR